MSSVLRPVAKLGQLREGLGHLAVVDGREIALFRRGDEVLAVDARCPHAGGPLQEGMVCGEVVVCPLHLRRVDLRSGQVDDWPEAVRTYPVVVEDGMVLILLT
jgi:nitrite reductase (NADH) small subunit